VGSALFRWFARLADVKVLVTTRAEVDLTDSHAVDQFLAKQRPDIVVIAAGRVGGILANSTYPAEFIYENLMIEANLIHGSWKAGVHRLLNFGSGCMYPKHCSQPMSPELLMTGRVEPTSEPYAIAKLAGLSLCDAYNRQYGTSYVTAIPCNVYGPGDSLDPIDAHVISALIRKFHEGRKTGAYEVTVWGSGVPRREFLYVDDLAEACEILLRHVEAKGPVNIGADEAYTIRELATMIADIVGFRGTVRWDTSRPDGAQEKLLDSAMMRSLGWSPRTSLRVGLEQTYRWFMDNSEAGDRRTICGSL
jgi:GDP-L-fucose synthase